MSEEGQGQHLKNIQNKGTTDIYCFKSWLYLQLLGSQGLVLVLIITNEIQVRSAARDTERSGQDIWMRNRMAERWIPAHQTEGSVPGKVPFFCWPVTLGVRI